RPKLTSHRTNANASKRPGAERQAGCDAGRPATADLRRETALAEARMQSAVDVEHELRAQLADAATHGSQKSSDAESGRAAAAAKQVAALTADLEAERRAVAELRAARAEGESREARWEKERVAYAERNADQLASLTSKLEAEQRVPADLRRRETELEARLAAEKATAADLRHDMQHAQERGHSGNQDAQAMREALAIARAEVQG